MNKYDELFDFRIATVNDIDNIMLFIKEEWNYNHILAHDKNFFIWMYGNEDSSEINFVLMVDKNNNIKGLNGFIKYSQDSSRLYVSSAITKVSNSVTIPLAGVELIKRFHLLINAKGYYSYGTNPKTMIPIAQRIFKYDTGYMDQYYRLNNGMDNFSVAVVNNKVILPIEKGNCRLCQILSKDELSNYDFERNYDNQAYKSKEFIIKRYFKHPIYSYKLFFISEGNSKHKGLLIAREISVLEGKILRIMDYIGDLTALRDIGHAIDNLIIENNYEYVDFYEKGIPEEYMREIGFIKNTGENIIPHYFEPFVQENIKLMYQRSNKNIVIFKADGDQDRPNI